jgi:ABC-2 type transport system ATP-binding protein
VTEPVIETSGLSRSFKKTLAVDGLDLVIAPGELFGLIGPDGAGKTTTLRLLAGLLNISAGTATVLGRDLGSQAEDIKPHVGYMAQQFSLYAELSVQENLRLFAELFDVPSGELAGRAERLLAFAGLTEFKARRAAHLSGGMQKKLALACTLVHQPELLLLDEPTTGVDPISRREFWNILTELHVQGTTIIVSTPYMDEADRCSCVGLMYAGRLIECDTPVNVRGALEGNIVEVQVQDWQPALEIVSKLPGIREVQTYGEALHVLVDSGAQRLAEIRTALAEADIAVRSMRIAPARMEDVFLSVMGQLEEP